MQNKIFSLEKILSSKFLALFTFVIALFAALTGMPQESLITQEEFAEKYKIQKSTINSLDVELLAFWIMDRQDDFVVFDLRHKRAFQRYHIPFAHLISPAASIEAESINHDKKLILCSLDGRLSFDVWQKIYNSKRDNIYLLSGGLKAWSNKIMFPLITEEEEKNSEYFNKKKKISMFFGGWPKMQSGTSIKTKSKFLREGC